MITGRIFEAAFRQLHADHQNLMKHQSEKAARGEWDWGSGEAKAFLARIGQLWDDLKLLRMLCHAPNDAPVYVGDGVAKRVVGVEIGFIDEDGVFEVWVRQDEPDRRPTSIRMEVES